MESKTLEEIFWKDGKFVNSKNEEVKPEPIGEAQKFEIISSEFLGSMRIYPDYHKEFNDSSLFKLLENLKKVDKKYEEVNTFSRGKEEFQRNSGDTTINRIIYPCNFYKI